MNLDRHQNNLRVIRFRTWLLSGSHYSDLRIGTEIVFIASIILAAMSIVQQGRITVVIAVLGVLALVLAAALYGLVKLRQEMKSMIRRETSALAQAVFDAHGYAAGDAVYLDKDAAAKVELDEWSRIPLRQDRKLALIAAKVTPRQALNDDVQSMSMLELEVMGALNRE